MQKNYSSFIFDFIFILLSIFFISFIWIRSFVHNNSLIWVYSLSITAILGIILFSVLKKKITTYSLSKKEEKTKKEILNMLLFSQKSEINKYLIKFFENENITKHNEFFTFNKEEKYIVFNNFEFDSLSLQNLLTLIKKAQKENCNRVYIFCNNYSKECVDFIKNLKNIKVKLVNFDTFYFSFIKKQNIYPAFSVCYEEKGKYKFKELLSIAFNKNKTKRYLLTGLIFLIGSIFLRYNIYYLVFTSLMFIFAMFSYFNNIYNKKIDDTF